MNCLVGYGLGGFDSGLAGGNPNTFGWGGTVADA
jgi:hypothetical protein